MSKVAKEVLREYVRDQKFETSEQVLEAMKEMFKDVIQEALESEMDDHLGYDKYDIATKSSSNSRNGYSKKTVKSELGSVELDIPRDRAGEFEAKIVPKYQRNITGIEDKILGLYSKGMTTRDISEQIKDLYDVEISAEMVSNITNRVMPLVTEWQNRPLDNTYTFVFMDAIHYKVRDEKQVVVKAAYVVVGVNINGEKEVLGIWIGANESSKFWLGVLNDLKNRGVEKVIIF
jgi:transposase-like protein